MFYKRTDIRITSVQSIQSTKIRKKLSKIRSIQSANNYENMKMKSQSTNIFLLLRQINQYSHFLPKVFGAGYCGF